MTAIPQEPRTWLYGLTADEWLHLAAEGQDSELPPCCGNLSEIRELLNTLATSQGGDNTGWQLSIGRHLLQVTEADGDGHNLRDRELFPLFHRVLDGIRDEQSARDAHIAANRNAPGQETSS